MVGRLRDRITASATTAAEKGARDEVRKVMERLLQPVVEKAMANGVEVNVEGPGGIVLLSIRLRIPDEEGGLSSADKEALWRVHAILSAHPSKEQRVDAILAMEQILDRQPLTVSQKNQIGA